jgi:phage antirepressor YoqD-like protein
VLLPGVFLNNLNYFKNMTANTFSICQTAKLTGFPGGEKKFFEWLRIKRILMQDNFPFQSFMDQAWFEIALKTLYKTKSQMKVPVTRVTIKGVYCLSKLVKKEFSPCKPCDEDGKK